MKVQDSGKLFIVKMGKIYVYIDTNRKKVNVKVMLLCTFLSYFGDRLNNLVDIQNNPMTILPSPW